MEKKLILQWMLTFIFPLSSLILYIMCLDSHLAWQGVLTVVLLAIFAILYTLMNKKITHKDGYTYVQALFFYIKSKKNGVECKNLNDEQKDIILNIGKSLEWAQKLDDTKIVVAYSLGRKIYKQFKNNI